MTALIVKLERTRDSPVRLSVKSAQVECTLPKWQTFVLLVLRGHIRRLLWQHNVTSAQRGNIQHNLVAPLARFALRGPTITLRGRSCARLVLAERRSTKKVTAARYVLPVTSAHKET